MALAVGCQGLRWWAIRTLGRHWNTRVIVVPGASRVRGGPYRFLDHPNYVAVWVGMLALPLSLGLVITPAATAPLNLLALRKRIRVENENLG